MPVLEKEEPLLDCCCCCCCNNIALLEEDETDPTVLELDVEVLDPFWDISNKAAKDVFNSDEHRLTKLIMGDTAVDPCALATLGDTGEEGGDTGGGTCEACLAAEGSEVLLLLAPFGADGALGFVGCLDDVTDDFGGSASRAAAAA